MDTIKVTIDAANNTISVYNNGQGIPVEIHKKENVYVPELIFGHLLTSSNYDDTEKKVTGGRNGYGAKLCNIFSTEFIVETSNKQSGKGFIQVINYCKHLLVIYDKSLKPNGKYQTMTHPSFGCRCSQKIWG
jgi:DNA topoisomerase II